MTDPAPMADREKVNELIAEFTANLSCFATGSYLRDHEKEFWEPPFDAAAIPKVRGLLDQYVQAVGHLVDELIREDIPEYAHQEFIFSLFGLYCDLAQLNAQYHYAVLEAEEEKDIEEILSQLWMSLGIIPAVISTLPTFEDFRED